MSADDDARLLAYVKSELGKQAAAEKLREVYRHPSESRQELEDDWEPVLDTLNLARWSE